MTTDSARSLVDLAGMVTGVGVDRAKDAVRTLLTAALEVIDNPAEAVARFSAPAGEPVKQAGDTDGLVHDMSERIREEVDRVAARFGFVREEELAAVRARVQRLEGQLASLEQAVESLRQTAPAGNTRARSAAKKNGGSSKSTTAAPVGSARGARRATPSGKVVAGTRKQKGTTS